MLDKASSGTPEKEFKIEILKLMGQIHCDLNNFTTAVEDMRDVYEIIGVG